MGIGRPSALNLWSLPQYDYFGKCGVILRPHSRNQARPTAELAKAGMPDKAREIANKTGTPYSLVSKFINSAERKRYE